MARKKKKLDAPVDTQVRIETVPLPKAPEPSADRAAPPEDRGGEGYEAAKRIALGGDPEPQAEQPADAPPPGPERVQAERVPDPFKDLPPLPPEKTLLMLTELGTVMSCRFYAARLKVPWTDKLKQAIAFTPQEKADLEQYAPYAVPFMDLMIVKYGAYIGAAIYGFVFWTALTDRFAALKELAPKKEEKKDK